MSTTSETTETEIKLRVDRAEFDRLRASPWWRALEGATTKALHSTYFDTPDRGLRKAGVSLRTRNKNDLVEQTMKMTRGAAGAFERHEWSTVIPDNVPDPALVIDAALPESIRMLTASDLRPVFDIDVTREVRRWRAKETVIEFALDDGAVVDGARRAPLCEIELELQEGSRDRLIEQARRIVDLAGGRLHLRAKADVGYAAAGPEPAAWSRAEKLTLAADADVGAALQQTLLNALGHLTANDDCARRAGHIEGVHQCRIALRRMRTAMRLFDGVAPPKRRDRLVGEMKWLAAILGEARDLDVLEADLLAPAARAVDAPEDVAPLIAALDHQRRAAYDRVAAAMNSSRYGQFLLDVFALAVTDDWRAGKRAAAAAQPARDFAAGALEKIYGKVLKGGRHFKRKSAKERHALRILIKRMRYASDSLSSLFKGRKTRGFLKDLAALQDGLGDLNDVVVAEGLLSALIDHEMRDDPATDKAALSYAAGCVLGWHRRRAAETNDGLEKRWRRFRKAEPFWR